MSQPHPVVAPVLSDGVVTLRPHQDSDEDAVVEQCRDPKSVRWTSVPRPYGPEQARAFISAAARGWAQGGNRVWAVEVTDPLTGRPRFAGSSTTARTAPARPSSASGCTRPCGDSG